MQMIMPQNFKALLIVSKMMMKGIDNKAFVDTEVCALMKQRLFRESFIDGSVYYDRKEPVMSSDKETDSYKGIFYFPLSLY